MHHGVQAYTLHTPPPTHASHEGVILCTGQLGLKFRFRQALTDWGIWILSITLLLAFDSDLVVVLFQGANNVGGLLLFHSLLVTLQSVKGKVFEGGGGIDIPG